MNNSFRKPAVALLGASLTAATLLPALSAQADSNPFTAQPLSQGYNLAAHHEKEGEGKCGEGKCGEKKTKEGKCGEDKAKKAEGEGKCGEGKCGGDK